MIHNSITTATEKKDYFENEIEKKRKSQEKKTCGNVELKTHKTTKKYYTEQRQTTTKKNVKKTTSYKINGVK